MGPNHKGKYPCIESITHHTFRGLYPAPHQGPGCFVPTPMKVRIWREVAEVKPSYQNFDIDGLKSEQWKVEDLVNKLASLGGVNAVEIRWEDVFGRTTDGVVVYVNWP